MTKRRLRWMLAAAAVALVAAAAAVAVRTHDDPDLPDRFWVCDGGPALYDAPDGGEIRTGWRFASSERTAYILVEWRADAPRPWPLSWLDEIRPTPAVPAMPAAGNWRTVRLGATTARGGSSRPVWIRSLACQSLVTVIHAEVRASGQWRECVKSLDVLAPGERRPSAVVGRWSHPCTDAAVDRLDVTLRADGSIVLADGTPAGLWAADGGLLFVQRSDPQRAWLADGTFWFSDDRRAYGHGRLTGRRVE